jgi:monoamine oxidase
VTLLEARNRIGGRIYTLRDPELGFPIELGADFIHGRPPEILDPLDQAHVPTTEVEGPSWCVFDQQLGSCDFFPQVDSILSEMDDSRPDESFLAFLNRRFPLSEGLGEAKERAIGYVSGFNAADPGLVGVHWLVNQMRAEEKIEGHRSFRSENGYQDLIDLFRRDIDAHHAAAIHTGMVVKGISWKQSSAEVIAQTDQGMAKLSAPRVLVTLPLALLKARLGEPGVIQFSPPLPQAKLDSLEKLEVGKVIRVTLRFQRRFWETISPPAGQRTLSDMSFLFSADEWFPTWWTAAPKEFPIITGWAPFIAGERLSGKPAAFVVQRALDTLSSLLNTSERELEGNLEDAHFHDWQCDPFSRGAYSYGKVDSDGAQQALAAPVQNTLYFAGEATDTSGHNGTVHGAMASGYRAAREILHASS